MFFTINFLTYHTLVSNGILTIVLSSNPNVRNGILKNLGVQVTGKNPQQPHVPVATPTSPLATTPSKQHRSNRAHSSNSRHNHHSNTSAQDPALSSNNHNNPVRPSTSASTHTRHKSTDSLAGPPNAVSSPPPPPPQQPQPSTSSQVSSGQLQSATSPSPASLNSLIKFPNFNIPPPCSVMEQSDTTTVLDSTTKNQNQRITLHRSHTSVGSGVQNIQAQDSRLNTSLNLDARNNNHQAPPSTTPTSLKSTGTGGAGMLHSTTNNFAHSPVPDRREFPDPGGNRRAQSNPPGARPSTGKHGFVSTGAPGGVVPPPPPVIDRSKKPASQTSCSNPNVFYPITMVTAQTQGQGKGPSSSTSTAPVSTPAKPVPPPKPKIVPRALERSGDTGNPRRNGSNNASNLHELLHQESNDSIDDTGQTYLNIPMNSKAAIQAHVQQQQFQQQQQQQFLNVSSGYFDSRGGRLVQKVGLNLNLYKS